MDKNIKNVILYCRVSSDEQAKGTSLDFQENTLREYCRRNGYNIIDCYREDFSGKTFKKRPEIQKLMNFCRSNKKDVDDILFYTWDRYSRNLEYALTNIRQLKALDITVNSILNPLDATSLDFPTMLGIYIGNAEAEINKISHRTKNGIHDTLEMGKCANKAPRGYKNIKISDHDKYVIIDEVKAPIIQQIFKQVAKGTETPSYIRRQFERSGFKINKNSFFDMLRNHFYIGQIFVPEFSDIANKRIIPAHYVKGVHEAIIDKETFYKVQEIIDGKKKSTPKLSKKIHPDLFLRKYLACPVCGASLTGAPSKGNGGVYYYYNCSKDGKHFRCGANKANEEFAKYTATLKPNSTVLDLYKTVLKDLNNLKKEDSKKVNENIRTEIEKVNDKINNLDDKYLLNEIDKSMYDRLLERCESEKRELQAKIKIQETPNHSNIEQKLDYSISLITNIDNYIRDAKVEVKCKLISSMFPEKIVFDGKTHRTNSYNSVLDLIYQQTNELRGNKKGQIHKNMNLSYFVPRLGVEPRWK